MATQPSSEPSSPRAAELGVYLPRVPTRPMTEASFGKSNATLSTKGSEFAWNEQPVEIPPSPVQSQHVVAIEEVLTARVANRSSSVAIADAPSIPIVAPASSESNNVPIASTGPWVEPPVSQVWGLDFHCVNMQQTLDCIEQIVRDRKPTFAVTANLNYAMLCAQHARLKEFTRKAALVLCDGMPILWRSKCNTNQLPERVAGSDLIYRIAERSAKTKLRIYLYGAAEGVAAKAANELSRLYPGCNIVGVQCPPFRATSEAEVQAQLASIQQAKPDVLLVALGQPKGEYWIEDHLDRLSVPLSIQVGASFDFVAGNAQRAPALWQRLGGEWLYRMLKDPKRLAPRYLKNAICLLRFLHQDCIQWFDSPSKKDQ